MRGNFKYQLILNLVVLVWGFTGVLGDEIQLSSERITFFRTGIAFFSLLLLGLIIPSKKELSLQQMTSLMFTGFIVGLHWLTFFHSIKISTISIGVVCMSSSTLFTALLEPIIFKRKILASEIILSFFILSGILFIFGFEPEYTAGIIVGLISAFLASLFSVINGRHIKNKTSLQITKFEMFGGFLVLAIILGAQGKINAALFTEVTTIDWIYLLILGLICTTAAFMVSVWIMKFVTPFTVSLSINMEPIYAILIALIISYSAGETIERMSLGFYTGTTIIIGSIFFNAYLKKRRTRRANNLSAPNTN